MLLTREQNKRFNRILCGLLDYTNELYDIVPGLDFSFGLPEDMEAVALVKDYLWENDNIIKDYITVNPNKLNINDCMIVSNWQYHNTGIFFYIGEDEGLSIFSDAYNFFGVKGHSKEIRTMLGIGEITKPVMTTLLPFENDVVYDTTISSYPISMGPNMTENLDIDFLEEKENDGIIKDSKRFIQIMKIPKTEKQPRELRTLNDEEEDDMPVLTAEKRRELLDSMEDEIKEKAKEIAEEILRETKKSIIKAEPSNDLETILMRKTKDQLHEMIKKLKISGVSAQKKATLVYILIKELYIEDFLKNLFLFCEDEEMEMLDRIVKEKQMLLSKESFDSLMKNKFREYAIFIYLYEDNYYAVVPDEFCIIYNKIMNSGYARGRILARQLHDYANAMVSLYGSIPMNDFIKEFNDHNSESVTEAEVEKYLEVYMVNAHGLFEIIDKDIVHFEIADDYDWYEYVKGRNEKYPRKIFPKDVVEKYYNENYFEQTHEMKLIREFIKENDPEFYESQFLMESLIDDLYDSFVSDEKIEGALKLFEKKGLIFEFDQMNTLLSLIMNARNNNIIWGNNGHSPNEFAEKFSSPEDKKMIEGMSKAFLQGASHNNDHEEPQKPIVKPKKIGRNDPCPCGSGKKYKNCCMLNDN